MYPHNGYTVEGAQMCVKPCGEESYEDADMFCEVIKAIIFISCEGAAQEVLMSVWLSVCPSICPSIQNPVEILTSFPLSNVPQCLPMSPDVS